MENLLRQAREIKEQGTFTMANTAGRPLPTVAIRDIAAAAAALLLDTSWSGQASGPATRTPPPPPASANGARTPSSQLSRPDLNSGHRLLVWRGRAAG